MGRQHVLVVDDDKLNAELLTTLLERESCHAERALNGRQAWERFRKTPADLVFMDLRMPRMNGMELLKKIKSFSPRTTVVMMTAYATVETAVEAIKFGAYDYISKPFRSEQIATLLRQLRDKAKPHGEYSYLLSHSPKEHEGDRLITVDENMTRICKEIQLAAQSKASVLVQGESGTGKELVAKSIHEHSPRKDKPFIKVNCAALPEGLLESELFGHEKGAFTNAITERHGRFELAHDGTILLDEISEISPAIQAKLLRVLEEEEFERVGGSATLSVDVRVVATTNKNLQEEIRAGAFREDLYYRLNVIPIVLPPLRARKGDVAHLANWFLRRFARQNGRPVAQVSDEALRLMRRYSWPGNVRELKNLMHRLVILNVTDAIRPEHLPLEIRSVEPSQVTNDVSVGHTIQDAERWLILKTLEQTSGNRTEAARLLGVTTRTLRNKLARYRREAGNVRLLPALQDNPSIG